MDFTDLNKTCPKDSFPLSKIDQVVDATFDHKRMSFLDVYMGYHQILMHKKDEEERKTKTWSAPRTSQKASRLINK